MSGIDRTVAIVGGGPSGLSAAIELRRLGVDRVTVYEREQHAGGIPATRITSDSVFAIYTA